MQTPRWLGWVMACVLGLLLVASSVPGPALAHERRTLASGKYEVVVGWDTEPAYIHQHNAIGIRVSRAGTNPAQPVTGVERTLQVQVRQGGQARSFGLRAVFGQPGYYVADLVPTRAGDYALTFTGSIGTDAINETFDSADGKFDAVAPTEDVEFPVAEPDADQVRLELQSAQAAAHAAQMTAYIGTAIGVLGCVLAVLAWLTRPRWSAGVLSSRDAAVRRVPGSGGIRAG